MTAFNTTPEAMSSEVTESDNTGSSITGSNVSSVCVCMGGGEGGEEHIPLQPEHPVQTETKAQ